MANRIYLAPQSGQNVSKLLVFDYVESMNHVSTSVVPQHPVESINKSIADHRFKKGKKISITGMVSDNWDTSLVEVISPEFETAAKKDSKVLRTKGEETLGKESATYKLMVKILDRKQYFNSELDDVPTGEQYWIAGAFRSIASDGDFVNEIYNKGIPFQNRTTNLSTSDGNVNTISEAREILKDLDDNSILVTVYSMYEEYPNMVISSFSNPLRNGVQRGAYWVQLNLEEQLIASDAANILSYNVDNSEYLSNLEDKDKVSGKDLTANDKVSQVVLALWTELYEEKAADDPKFIGYMSKENEATIKGNAQRAYGVSGNGTSIMNAEAGIRNGITQVYESKGKVTIRSNIKTSSTK